LINSANVAEAGRSKAVPAGSIGRFRERPVPGCLAASFAALWIHRMPDGGVPPIIVAPDATIDLQGIDAALCSKRTKQLESLAATLPPSRCQYLSRPAD
jgi:hypothetical protein